MNKFCLLFLGVCQTISMGAKAQEPDLPLPVLQKQLKEAKTDTARLHITLRIADTYTASADSDLKALDTASNYLRLADADPVTRSNPWLKGTYELSAAKIFEKKLGSDKHDSAIARIDLALRLLQPYRFDWAKACYKAGDIYTFAKDAREDSLVSAYYKMALPIFDSLHANWWIALTLQNLGYRLSDPKKALSYLLRAAEVARTLVDPDLRTLDCGLATAYTALGDQRQALNYALLAARQDESNPSPDPSSVVVYNVLAKCYSNVANYKQAADNFGRSLELSARFRDTAAVHANLNNMITADLNIGQYDTALTVLRRVSRDYPSRNRTDQIRQASSFASIFDRMDKPDSMLPYVQRLVLLDAQLPAYDRFRSYTLPPLASYNNTIQKYSTAQKYARDLLQLGGHLGTISLSTNAYRLLAIADSGLGNYKLSIDEYHQYVHLRDSLRDVDNTKQVATLNLQYETEKKDKDILALNHKQALSGIALHQAMITRNFIIGGIILLLILLAVLINRYRLKQRSNQQLNRLLTEKDSLLSEKEWLLKEIHHRVKNNLQIGISLLNLQSYHIENEKAQSAIRQSRNRMYAMSLIHQRLYQADNLKTIDMRQYVRELVDCISDSYSSEKQIDFDLSVASIDLDVEHALPIGLILNETITNSLKYAFPNRSRGRISISLVEADTRLRLSIIDDGVGIPSDFDFKRHQSMGTQLIDILVQQLDGTINMQNNDGLTITIEFPIPVSVAVIA